MSHMPYGLPMPYTTMGPAPGYDSYGGNVTLDYQLLSLFLPRFIIKMFRSGIYYILGITDVTF